MTKEEAEVLINKELEEFIEPYSILDWWTIPNRVLNGKTPREYLDIDPEGLYNLITGFGR